MEVDGVGHCPHIEKPSVVLQKYYHFRESIKPIVAEVNVAPTPQVNHNSPDEVINKPTSSSSNNAKKLPKL